MKRPLLALSLVLTLVILSGCMATTAMNGINSADLHAVNFGNLSQMKRGESCSVTILMLFTDGSSLVSAAARAGGLSKVELVEYTSSSNPLFSKQCAIVYGS